MTWFDRGNGPTLQNVTYQRLIERLLTRLACVLAVGVVALAFVPASASARPDRDARAEQENAGDLDWGAVTLAAGAVALLVVGALGMAAADDRRYLPPGG
jgi:hypothetical protein